MEQRNQIIETLRAAGIRYGHQVRTAAGSGTLAEPLVRVQAGEDKNLMRWILTTELEALVWDWDQFDFVKEVLVMEGMRTPAIGQVPLLDSHNRFSVDDVLGHVRDFQHDDFSGYRGVDGAVFWAADEKSQRTEQKAVDGHITDGSVGYSVDKSIWIPEGHKAAVHGREFEGPLKVSYEWSLKEFSITPIGADVLAKVRDLRRAMGQ